MGIQVQELIDKIKSEGVRAAQDEASRIVEEARAKAAKIVSDAQRQAADASAGAKESLARDQAAGREALAQASRDTLLQLGKEMQKVLDRVVSREVKAAYSEQALKEILPGLISAWKKSDSEKLSVLLSAEDLAKLESFFNAKFQAELSKGIEFKPSASLKAGFKIVERSGAAYFDFSSDALAELLAGHLNPALAETMKKAAKEG